MPPHRSDTRLLLMAAGAVLVAGALVAAVLLFATQGGGPKSYAPFPAGLASSFRANLRDGGPYYFPDPFGGQRSILFALEHGDVVALSTVLPGTKDCRIKWKGRIDRFVDCHGDPHRSVELDRYDDFIDPAGENKGILFVDLRKKLPAPEPTGSAN